MPDTKKLSPDEMIVDQVVQWQVTVDHRIEHYIPHANSDFNAFFEQYMMQGWPAKLVIKKGDGDSLLIKERNGTQPSIKVAVLKSLLNLKREEIRELVREH
jgi:hypothetical protein